MEASKKKVLGQLVSGFEERLARLPSTRGL